MSMPTLLKRVLSAIVLGPATVAAIIIGGPFFYVFMAFVFVISVQEWSRLSMREGRIQFGLMGFGVVYVGIACLSAVFLRLESIYPLLYPLVAIWACDSGAYLAGKTIGGPKMAPDISPNKTWAGLIGGSVSSGLVLLAFGLNHHDFPTIAVLSDLSPVAHFLMGLTLGVVGQVGDIFISALKRKCGLKDTGNIIPGHGGLLDRIDALLLVLPIFALYFLAILSFRIAEMAS